MNRPPLPGGADLEESPILNWLLDGEGYGGFFGSLLQASDGEW
jgi:hypothetical protein